MPPDTRFCGWNLPNLISAGGVYNTVPDPPAVFKSREGEETEREGGMREIRKGDSEGGKGRWSVMPRACKVSSPFLSMLTLAVGLHDGDGPLHRFLLPNPNQNPNHIPDSNPKP